MWLRHLITAIDNAGFKDHYRVVSDAILPDREEYMSNDKFIQEVINHMPKNTKVHKMYEAMKREGMPTEKAAKIAQAKTQTPLKSGKTYKKK